MDAAALMIVYTLHSGERCVMRRPIVEAAACEQMKRAVRASRRGKGWVLYCSPRSVPAAGPGEPKAFLTVTWKWPKGGQEFWRHPYPSVTACHAAAADAHKLALAQGGDQTHYECKTDIVTDKVPPTAG